MKKIFKFGDNFQGAGPIYFSWQKGATAKYLVTTGLDQIVNLHDRYFNKVDSFNLNGVCCGLEWNETGDLLAIITERSSVIRVWDAINQKVLNVDFLMKESLNILLWSIKMPNLLAITTVKGCWTNQNLLALVCEDRYLSISDESGDTVFQTNLKLKCNLVKSSLQPIEFSSIKNETGHIQIESYCISVVLNRKQIILLPINSLDQPLVLSFEERYEDIFDYYWQSNGQLLIAFTSGFIINVQTTGNQLGQELMFVKVFNDTLTGLNLCESTGSLAVIHKNVIKLMNTSTLGQIDTIYVVEDEQELEWLEWSQNGQMLAVSSIVGNLDIFLIKLPNVNCSYQTKIAYLSSLLEISFIDIEQEKLVGKERNQVLLHIEPSLICIGNSHLASCINNRAYFYELNTSRRLIEKSMQNDTKLMKEKEYSGIVKHILMNDQYAAILFTDNKSILHRIPQLEDFGYDSDSKRKDFYQVDTKLTIACIELTNSFFIWCTDAGYLELFSIEEWATVSAHRHTNPIRMICSDFLGLRILLIDERNEAFVFDASNEQLTPVETRQKDGDVNDDSDHISFDYEELSTDRIVVGQRNYAQTFPLHVIKIFWDLIDHPMFGVVEKKQILIFYYVSKSIQGSFVQMIGKSSLEENIVPFLSYDGFIFYQSSSGTIASSKLETHNYTRVIGKRHKNEQNSFEPKQEKIFENLLKLRRIADCWLICKTLNRLNFWLQFIDCCLHDLNLGEAIRIARYIGHAGVVWSLKSIRKIEDRNLLSGHIAMYLKWFDLAEKLYLKSSQPTCALRLRLDLMQWNLSLVLARRLASDQLPFIHKQQANELEFEENFSHSLDHYQDALLDKSDLLSKQELDKHNRECLAGISRCLIKCGDSKKGVQIAMKLNNDPELVARSAQICVESNLFDEAAALYEKIDQHENACLFYLKTRNSSKLKEILQQQQKNTNSPDMKKILIQFGKLQEQDGKFMDAYRAYEQAEQSLDCVRLLLDKLNKPQEAVRLVRQQRTTSDANQQSSTEACLLIAKHFEQINDYESAIEFLVYSEKFEEAFELALQESQMNIYTNALVQILQSSNGSTTELNLGSPQKYGKVLTKQLQRIAIYYEEEQNLLNSGKFYCFAGQQRKGIHMLLKAHQLKRSSFKHTQINDATNREDALKLAIEFACKSNDEQSIQQVIEVLVNDLGNENQTDFQYLFKLYMCSNQYREATKTALLLAKEEQTNGNYDAAHGLLVEMCRNLLSNNIKISFELLSALHLLHCYKLAKLYLKNDNLEKSCELLCKVSNSISKFPKNAAQILSTTIVECLKLGIKSQAIQYSTVLLQNNTYIEQLDSKFRRKIEILIRKSASTKRENSTDNRQKAEESFCPFCDSSVPKFQLSCNSCRAVIPFCIFNGYHLIKTTDCYQCNSCLLPFMHIDLDSKLFEQENVCPACSAKIDTDKITKLESLTLAS